MHTRRGLRTCIDVTLRDDLWHTVDRGADARPVKREENDGKDIV
jgi:hypothetical protein